jgi:hypothetical protein
MPRWFIVAAIVLTAWPSSSSGQKGKFVARVKLKVTCDQCKDIVTSYLSRELRKFSDVVLADDFPDWELDVVVLATENQARVPTGYAMAVVILDTHTGPSAAAGFRNLASQCPEKTGAAILYFAKQDIPSLVRLEDFWVHTLPLEGLESRCREVVAGFDGAVLEPSRKRFQDAEELLKQFPAPK